MVRSNTPRLVTIDAASIPPRIWAGVIDNLEGELSSGHLARALTCSVWNDRMLHASKEVSLRQRATWIATGNNVALGGDMARRCYRVRLDAKLGRPWQGRNFKHPNLLEWVSSNRGRLIAAMLTLCRAWHVAGRPSGSSPALGSFENWSVTIGSILTFAGVRGFLQNLDNLYEQTDIDVTEWETFLQAWHARYESTPTPVSKILSDLENGFQSLRESLPGELAAMVTFVPSSAFTGAQHVIREAGKFKIGLGLALKFRVGRRYGLKGLHLVRSFDEHTKTALWAVIPAGSAGEAGTVENIYPPRAPARDSFKNTPATPRTPRDDYEDEERAAIASEGM